MPMVSTSDARKPIHQHRANLSKPLVDFDVILKQAPIFLVLLKRNPEMFRAV
jgi:hypothetical protein